MSAVAAPVRRPSTDTRRRAAADERRRRHLRVVPEARPRHTLRFALLYVVLAGATVFGTVSLNALAAGDAVAARQLEQELVSAEREYAALVAEVARLEDPARIRAAALDLGLVPAGSVRFLVVDRTLPADGVTPDLVASDDQATDPLKPVLSVEK
jgi:cell division protein FtsB